jgi:hypothetical protein
VKVLKSIRRGDRDEMFLLAEDLEVLETVIRDLGNVALVNIDPITAFMGSGKSFDSHRATDVRSQLSPLKALAERTRVTISAITHPAKNAGSRALDHFLGSQAFIAAARCAHLAVPEMEDGPNGGKRQTGRVFFTHPKTNIQMDQPTLVYRRVEVTVGFDEELGKPIAQPVLEWEQEFADITADEAIAQATSKGNARRGPEEFLDDILTADPVSQTTVMERGFSPRQLRRAKDKLGVDSHKDGKYQGAWTWALIKGGKSEKTDGKDDEKDGE